MKRDSLTFGVAEEAAIDQYLRDKAEDEISTGDRRFCDWFLEKHDVDNDDIFTIVLSALQYRTGDEVLYRAVERLRNDYIESRIEDQDERAEAYRGLFEETSDVE